MSDIQLYCFGESGNAYKAALMLELAQVDWEPIHVDFFKGEARSEAFLKINPMGEVPVMIHNGKTYTQSGVMQDVIIELTGKFGGATPEERREIWRWVLFDNHKMSSQAGVLRFWMNFLPAEKRNDAIIGFLTGRMKAALNVLENELSSKDWLVGSEISAADISCCGYLFYPEEFNFDRSAFPNIDAWLTRISEQPNWKHPYDLMKRAFPA